MRAAGGGLIIYISSIAAHRPDLSGAAYQASKRGLLGLAHATRLEEKNHRIRTSVVLPGLCRTDLVHKRPTPTRKEVLNLALEPVDVADAVLAIARLHPRAVVPEMELVPSLP
jgi:short-subunit dehydrogenase